MPYKLRQDRIDNQRMWWQYGKKLPFYRSMGLEPLDLNNFESALRCVHCFKVTPRNCAHMFRHEPDCPHLDKVMEILGYPRTYWIRRRKAVIG